ncbi:MAG: RING finger protein [Candidatus Heimdallarchaeaceae archaeon]
MPKIPFSTFLLFVLFFSFANCFLGYDPSYAQNEILFSNVSYVDASTNTSFYIILEETNILHIQLHVSDWGESESPTSGLLISVYDDMNNSVPIASWLLLAGDNGNHYYQTELSSSIALIVFSPYKVKFATFAYSIANTKAVWAYRNIISNNDTYFIIERSSEPDTVISTMVLKFYPVVLTHNITIIINIRVSFQHTTSAQVEFSNNDTSKSLELNSSLHPYTEGQMYSIDFEILGDYSSILPQSILQFELYYEAINSTRIARIFAIQPSSLSLPIDNCHKNSNWTPLDSVENTSNTTIVLPPDPDPWISFSNLTLIILGTAYSIATVIVVFTVIQRKRHTKQQLIIDLPSKSLQKIPTPTAIYKPKPQVIKPTKENTSYELYTTQPKLITCAVCYQNIEDDRQLIRCPVCDVAFHRHHLYEWVKTNGTCPVCKAKLTVKELSKQQN